MDYYYQLLQYAGDFFFIGLQLGFIAYLFLKKIPREYHSRWSTSVNNFNHSSEDFYARLKEELETQNIKGLGIKKVMLKEGTIFSYSRFYLKVVWKDYAFYICAAPFYQNFFVSYWIMNRSTIAQILISRIPFFGDWLLRNLYPVTFYKIDTASMLLSYVHSATLKVYDEITTNSGVRALSEEERKPILNDIFKR
ncbi:MAG: hypothetical protein KDE33_05865 [Bacteroidetes bacterium]|nr:hypothetical protein [Bacteroidota bacterium]